ncbi:FMN-binding negative transcriptional regulator [Chitinophaga japonensis]|uniref:PaiB family negative transcriptional regulator n=1 Tax=Chitinophaga japonensis TaxID=104662 RepID=A0A562SL31_CHIJA|nr:FMN-binding negative transcriptional regulator [Chitinophaga japonensis]TWI82007.1 PaiB family negative transcriptional regulator [Chitinophaga japonensis]
MHIPKYNQEKDWQQVSAFIRENSFGILVNVAAGTPLATHIPIELEEKAGGTNVLTGHVARDNRQWEAFTAGPALAIFTAPHAYISSSWYEKEKIPTWNYIAVHVYGQMRLLTDAELLASLERLMTRYETASARPVHFQDIPEKELRNNLKAIVGFEMTITDVQARYKLSQNRNARDYDSVISHLKARGDEGSKKIAEEMEKRKK